MEMSQTVFLNIHFKMICELGTVVCLYMSNGYRTHFSKYRHEIGRSVGGVGHICKRKSELCFCIKSGDNVSLYPIMKTNNGIGFHKHAFIPLASQFLLEFARFFLYEISCFSVKRVFDFVWKFSSLFHVVQHSSNRGSALASNAVFFD